MLMVTWVANVLNISQLFRAVDLRDAMHRTLAGPAAVRKDVSFGDRRLEPPSIRYCTALGLTYHTSHSVGHECSAGFRTD